MTENNQNVHGNEEKPEKKGDTQANGMKKVEQMKDIKKNEQTEENNIKSQIKQQENTENSKATEREQKMEKTDKLRKTSEIEKLEETDKSENIEEQKEKIKSKDESKDKLKEKSKDKSKNESKDKKKNKEDKKKPKEKSTEEKLKDALKEIDDWKKKYMYLQAEMENTRKIMLKRMDMAKHDAKVSIIKQFLPLSESLASAQQRLEKQYNKLQSIIKPPQDNDNENSTIIDEQSKNQIIESTAKQFLDGFKRINNQFHQILKSNQVKSIDKTGVPFNYKEHEVLMKIDNEEHPEDTVIQIIQSGWMIGDNVLKPAKVVVSKKPRPKRELKDAEKEEQQKKESKEIEQEQSETEQQETQEKESKETKQEQSETEQQETQEKNT